MTVITQLTVVNECLSTMGEVPVNSLINEDHPYIAAALQSLELARIREMSIRWWFNEELAELVPDSVTKKISIPQDILDIDPIDPYSKVVQRGQFLYDSINRTYEFDSAIKCWIIADIPFDDLPVAAQMFVMYSAVLDFCKAYDADGQRVEQVGQSMARSMMTLRTLQIRNQDTNFLTQGSVGRKMVSVVYPGTTTVRPRSAWRR